MIFDIKLGEKFRRKAQLVGGGHTTTAPDSSTYLSVVSRDSQTGTFIFCNRAPVMWLSKKQNLVETSTFGFDFTVLKLAVKLVIELRYKMRMFGVPLKGPTDMFCEKKNYYSRTHAPQSPCCAINIT